MKKMTRVIKNKDIRKFAKLYMFEEDCKEKDKNNCGCFVCDVERMRECECILTEEKRECVNCKNSYKPRKISKEDKDEIEDEARYCESYYRAPLSIAVYYRSIKIIKYIFMVQEELSHELDEDEFENVKCDIERAFMAACEKGYEELANFFISIGIDVSTLGSITLFYCVLHDKINLAKFLLENKIDLTDDADCDPLFMAVKRNNLEMVKLLISHNYDVTVYNNQAVRKAPKKCKIEILNYLLSKGGDFNKLSKVNKCRILQYKYYRKWRNIVFKNFIRKVVTPLYYSTGFPGGEKEKENLEVEYHLESMSFEEKMKWFVEKLGYNEVIKVVNNFYSKKETI